MYPNRVVFVSWPLFSRPKCCRGWGGVGGELVAGGLQFGTSLESSFLHAVCGVFEILACWTVIPCSGFGVVHLVGDPGHITQMCSRCSLPPCRC